MTADDYHEILTIRVRLKEWASYVSAYCGPRYGNILAELIKYKGEIPKSSGPHVEPYNARAEEVEAAVLMMPQHLKEVICLRYLTNLSARKCAKELHIGFTKFYQDVAQGESWLLGNLQHSAQ